MTRPSKCVWCDELGVWNDDETWAHLTADAAENCQREGYDPALDYPDPEPGWDL